MPVIVFIWCCSLLVSSFPVLLRLTARPPAIVSCSSSRLLELFHNKMHNIVAGLSDVLAQRRLKVLLLLQSFTLNRTECFLTKANQQVIFYFGTFLIETIISFEYIVNCKWEFFRTTDDGVRVFVQVAIGTMFEAQRTVVEAWQRANQTLRWFNVLTNKVFHQLTTTSDVCMWRQDRGVLGKKVPSVTFQSDAGTRFDSLVRANFCMTLSKISFPNSLQLGRWLTTATAG